VLARELLADDEIEAFADVPGGVELEPAPFAARAPLGLARAHRDATAGEAQRLGVARGLGFDRGLEEPDGPRGGVLARDPLSLSLAFTLELELGLERGERLDLPRGLGRGARRLAAVVAG